MSQSPDPVALLNAWLAIEALQPQVFPKQEKMLPEDEAGNARSKRKKPPSQLLLPLDIDSGRMPWQETAGDRSVLGLSDEENLRWYLPLAFIKMKPAVQLLITNVEPDGPERETAAGVAILALVPFNEHGHPVLSEMALSSFGWACGEVLGGRIKNLHSFVELEEDLRREIGDPIIERAPDGTKIPTTKRGFIAGMNALMSRLGLPKEVLERPRVAIRIIRESDKQPVDIINSFILRDLHLVRTKVQSGEGGQLLDTYLAQTHPTSRQDVLGDKKVLETLVAPERIPLARWPAPSPAKLVTLQQAAVNAAMENLADGGLLAVNGPPGTGKTTLLRDIVAAVILERADALIAFEKPEKAFEPVDLVAEGGHKRTVNRLDPTLRGHGIVVASSNNAAVRNVSAELPLISTVSPTFTPRPFAGTADVVQGQEGACWGLIAAVLGNKANRFDFVEDAWWDPDWGLEKYFAAATGRLNRRKDDEPPKIVVAENPPTSRTVALERWRQAVLDYKEKRGIVSRMRLLREQIRTALQMAASAQQALEDAQRASSDAGGAADQALETRRIAAEKMSRFDASVADAKQLLKGTEALQPNILMQRLGLTREWQRQHQRALDLLENALVDQRTAQGVFDAAGERASIAEGKLAAARAALAAACEQLDFLRTVEAQGDAVYGASKAGPAFWEGDHTAIHTASPWSDDEFTAARDEMFAAAIRVHRAFIDAAAFQLKSNLGLMMDHLKGKRIPSGADLYLGDLWDTFFLVIPLVSTTFASFDRLMDGIGKGALGWLIVDEAGQAPPQATVGALWRSQRALIIGDPLQIEPVSKVPVGLVRAIFSSYGAHPDIWAAPKASIQTVADAASPLVATVDGSLGTRQIGLPLLVHRRCQDPMFSISNEIAYGGLMVHQAGAAVSPIADALAPSLSKSCWVNVVSSAEKWSPIEGNAVVDTLRQLAHAGIREPNLYLISPFRIVADSLRKFVLRSGVLDELGIPAKKQNDWGKNRIGTVHTFQGKEAEVVFLVLGASAPSSGGSRNWAGATPNILNVAVTRAKQALYVFGSHDAWAKAGVFSEAARLPIVDWPIGGSRESYAEEGVDGPTLVNESREDLEDDAEEAA